jgi:hypothetical protein
MLLFDTVLCVRCDMITKIKKFFVMSRHIRVFEVKHTHHSATSHWRVVIRNIIGVSGIACISMSWPIVKL